MKEIPALHPPPYYETPTTDLHFMLDQAFFRGDDIAYREIYDELAVRNSAPLEYDGDEY